MTPSQASALAQAAAGVPVHPCHHPTARDTCSCGRADCASPAKHPRTAHGVADATCDPGRIAGWWARWPHANVGAATGHRFDVLDVDPRHGGDESLAALIAEHGPLPATATVSTPSGGRHLYFAPTGTGNRAGMALGLDWRGRGGYVLVPPSRGLRGTYVWVATPRRVGIAAAPGWLHELVDPPRPAPSPMTVGAVRDGGGYARAALVGVAGDVLAAAPGTRNVTLHAAACRCGRLVAAGRVDAVAAAQVLLAAGEAVGLSAREVERTVASGLRAGTGAPR